MLITDQVEPLPVLTRFQESFPTFEEKPLELGTGWFYAIDLLQRRGVN